MIGTWNLTLSVEAWDEPRWACAGSPVPRVPAELPELKLGRVPSPLTGRVWLPRAGKMPLLREKVLSIRGGGGSLVRERETGVVDAL